MQGDVRAEKDLIDNGPRSTRRTKLICTIGPASRSTEMLATLAANGMNVARLNMCHGSQASHRRTIQNIRQLNKDKGCAPPRLCAPPWRPRPIQYSVSSWAVKRTLELQTILL